MKFLIFTLSPVRVRPGWFKPTVKLPPKTVWFSDEVTKSYSFHFPTSAVCLVKDYLA